MLSPGNLEREFSNAGQFSWLFELGAFRFGGLTSVGMRKQRQTRHLGPEALDAALSSLLFSDKFMIKSLGDLLYKAVRL